MHLGSFHEVHRLCGSVIAIILAYLYVNVNAQMERELQEGRPINLTLPSYPNTYSNNANVAWHISAPSGYRILATLGLLGLERNKDFLRFGDVFGRDLIKLTGRYSPPSIVSPTNEMWINFTSDDSSTDIGFLFELSTFNQSDAGVRLAEGTAPYNGRVEVYSKSNGWCTVSDDGWDLKDANTFCKQLGFPGSVKPLSNSYFGAGIGTVFMTDVDCNNDHFRLQDCSFNSPCLGCAHSKDASVICHKPNYLGCFNLPNIVDSSSSSTTVDDCITKCDRAGMMYAAINDQRCFCRSLITLPESAEDDTTCDQVCVGDSNQICGSGIHASIFSVYNTKFATCEDPGIPENGTRSGDFFHFGSVITFNCSEGFELIGEWRMQCIPGESLLHPKWNNNIPFCLALVDNSTMPTTNATIITLPQNSDNTTIVIVAAVVASFVFILFVLLFIFCIYKCKGCNCCRRRKRKRLEMWY